MKFGINAFGYRAEVDLTILQIKALLDVHLKALAPPAVASLSVTVATISLAIGISKIKE